MMATKVIPIWTVDRNRFGVWASSKTMPARRLPFFIHSSSRDLRAVMTAISAIAKMPLAKINKKMIIISPPIPDIAYAPLPYKSRRDGYWKTIQLDNTQFNLPGDIVPYLNRQAKSCRLPLIDLTSSKIYIEFRYRNAEY